jgi:hypothetical protein
VRSIIPFLRSRGLPPSGQRLIEPPSNRVLLPAPQRAVMAETLMTNTDPSLDQVVNALLGIMEEYLPPPSVPPSLLPAGTVSLVTMTERSAGLGKRIGNDTRGRFGVLALKGARVETAIRFQLWGDSPINVEGAIRNLASRLMGDKDTLRARGFLRLTLTSTSPSENIQANNAWRQEMEFSVLFEFPYSDSDGADSLIARIPIHLTGEFDETTMVSDDMVRWDEVESPALEVRRRGRHPKPVNSLLIFAFLPAGFDGDGVTISVSITGVTRQKTFPNLRAFHDAFDLEAETPERPLAELGGNKYRAGLMRFPNADFPAPILLTRGDDLLEISYALPSLGEGNKAVVHLRAI